MTVPNTTLRVSSDLAALYAKVSPITIRCWASRGHVTQYPDGYDLNEIDDWLDRRKDTMVRQRRVA